MIREGSLRDGYWVRHYGFGYLVGSVVGTDHFGEVSLEADGVYRYSKTSFTPIAQHIHAMKSGNAGPEWLARSCFLGAFPSEDHQAPRLMKAMILDIDRLLKHWDSHGTSLLGDEHWQEILREVLDALVRDDLHGLLALRTWTPQQLIESTARPFLAGRCDSRWNSMVLALLHTLSAPENREQFPCRRGAKFLRDARSLYPCPTFTQGHFDRALGMLDEFDALVSRGYPEKWAEKTVRCHAEHNAP